MVNPYEIIDRRLSAIESVLQELRQQKATAPATSPADALPFLSAAEVKHMTGWPSGTFYAKTGQMPPGVVIRGKSKRLLFDRAKLIAWLTDDYPVNDADNLPFGPASRKKGGVDL